MYCYESPAFALNTAFKTYIPIAPNPQKSAEMRATGRRDTGCEVAIRSLLHERGLRYRVDYPIPFLRRRRIDIAFPRQRLAIFVDGCFWNCCPRRHMADP